MKHRYCFVNSLVLSMTGVLGLASCTQNSSPTPPARTTTNTGTAGQYSSGTNGTGTNGTGTNGTGTNGTGTNGSSSNSTADVTLQPVLVTTGTGLVQTVTVSGAGSVSFRIGASTNVWSLVTGAFFWSNASTMCQGFGAGWGLPARTDLAAFASVDFSSQSFPTNMKQTRFWTSDQGNNGSRCAMTLTDQQACITAASSTGWSSNAADQFGILCLKSP